MFRTQSVAALSLVLGVAAAAVGCGPSELTTPSAAQVERLITEAFPDMSVRVREVNRSEQTLTVPAEFNEADVVFRLEAGESEWQIAGVEQAGNTYTVDELRDIATTMTTMRALSDGLEAFRVDSGAFPLLDDLVGLGELVPDYYPADGSMTDAWGEAFRYRPQGEDYTITSTGLDRQAGTPDDIILITGTFVDGDAG